MRLTYLAIIGLLVVTSFASVAQAADKSGRNFGTTNCRASFPCASSSSQDLAPLASSCTMSGLGASADFSSASLDSNNCITGPIGDNGKTSSAAICCVVPSRTGQDGMCSITCSAMSY